MLRFNASNLEYIEKKYEKKKITKRGNDFYYVSNIEIIDDVEHIVCVKLSMYSKDKERELDDRRFRLSALKLEMKKPGKLGVAKTNHLVFEDHGNLGDELITEFIKYLSANKEALNPVFDYEILETALKYVDKTREVKNSDGIVEVFLFDEFTVKIDIERMRYTGLIFYSQSEFKITEELN